MNPRRPVANRYRALFVVSLISSGSLLPLLPALADQNSPIPGVVIENQATATFTDAADNSTTGVLSDIVKVTVAEVAGISATNIGITGAAYRSNIVYFDFIVKNEGNDPTQLFIPPAPSNATIGGVALPAASIGQLQVIEYNTVAPGTNVVTTTPVISNNLVNTSTGSTTGSLSGVPNNGSVPAGGYIKVRVPITVPFGATIGDVLSVTLGNTVGQPGYVSYTAATPYNNNLPYALGANGTGTNDLYTQDNSGTLNNDADANPPINGDATNHRQEASATQVTTVVAPPNINISGTAWDDANGSGTATFTGIKDPTEAGANVTPVINAILVGSDGKVIATTPVATDGTYTFAGIPGVQNGLYVILSTTTGTVGTPAPTPSLPATWTNTSPLTYSALPFNIGIVAVTGKDFGIDKLPVTLAVSSLAQPNPPGTTQYTVPTLAGTDGEDGALGSGSTFKILTIPNPTTQGILYYDGVAVPATGLTITNYDPTKLKFDPVDGVVTMSFTYVAVDAAGKQDPNPATVTMPFNATNIGISGTVWNDKDNSAANTFINIKTGVEVGTDAVFGTTTVPVNAILVDTTTGFVIGTQLVAANGIYSFPSVPPNTNVKIILAPTAGTVGSAPPTAATPTGWVGTSPKDTGIFNTGLYPIVKDFGIRQKAKFVIVKRITKINGATTNPNDGTSLTGVTTDTFNNVGNWPANYLVGKTDAGLVKPSDTIEYTVYFLNNQGADATSVKICDPIRGAQTYVANSISLTLGTGTATSLSDGTNAYAANGAPSDCNAGAVSSTDPGVAIPISGSVPGATAVGLPTTSFGLFRFTTMVKP
jgi:hypothetical protein